MPSEAGSAKNEINERGHAGAGAFTRGAWHARVPRKRAHASALLDAQKVQNRRDPAGVLGPFAIVGAMQPGKRPRDDRFRGVQTLAVLEKLCLYDASTARKVISGPRRPREGAR